MIITDDQEDVCIPIIDDRIFEKFYTGNGNSLTKESGRMGLGLAIAKGIIKAHEDCIWLASEIDKGSTFVFTLPKKMMIRDILSRLKIAPAVVPVTGPLDNYVSRNLTKGSGYLVTEQKAKFSFELFVSLGKGKVH